MKKKLETQWRKARKSKKENVKEKKDSVEGSV